MNKILLGLTLIVSASFADLNYDKKWKFNEPTIQKINVEADKVKEKMNLICGDNQFIMSLNRLAPYQNPQKLQIVSVCKNKNLIDVNNFDSVKTEAK
jgi:hypothetical protein